MILSGKLTKSKESWIDPAIRINNQCCINRSIYTESRYFSTRLFIRRAPPIIEPDWFIEYMKHEAFVANLVSRTFVDWRERSPMLTPTASMNQSPASTTAVSARRRSVTIYPETHPQPFSFSLHHRRIRKLATTRAATFSPVTKSMTFGLVDFHAHNNHTWKFLVGAKKRREHHRSMYLNLNK